MKAMGINIKVSGTKLIPRDDYFRIRQTEPDLNIMAELHMVDDT